MKNMKKVEKIAISTNDHHEFNSEVKRCSGYGYAVVPGTMNVSSHERGPSSGHEQTLQKDGVRFIREVFFVQMEREVEIPDTPKDTD
jgi:hypothetical protein